MNRRWNLCLRTLRSPWSIPGHKGAPPWPSCSQMLFQKGVTGMHQQHGAIFERHITIIRNISDTLTTSFFHSKSRKTTRFKPFQDSCLNYSQFCCSFRPFVRNNKFEAINHNTISTNYFQTAVLFKKIINRHCR